MKPSLLIETATERGIVSLMDGDVLLFRAELPYGIDSSKFLISEIQRGCKEIGLSIKSLSYVAVGIGPGSFTGIRVAAATAQSIAYAAAIPLVGVSTLACFVPSAEGQYAVLIDAKIGGVYMMTAKKQSDAILVHSAPSVLPLSELSGIIDTIDCIVTPNSKVLKPKFEVLYGCRLQWEETAPDSHMMSHLAQEKIQCRMEGAQKPLDLQYLGRSQIAPLNKKEDYVRSK